MAAVDTKQMAIKTGLKGTTYRSILSDVIGQLSDGKWENSRVMEHYWPFVSIELNEDNDVLIVVYKPGAKRYCSRDNLAHNNWFYRYDKMNCDHQKIRNFFAKRIQQLVSDERKSYPHRGIKFNAKCKLQSDYLDGTVAELYEAYKTLKG